MLDELRNYQKAGLTPLEALRTATVEPARYLRRTEDFGAVAPGRIADLVLLSANPLEDISNLAEVHAVIANGKLIRGDELREIRGRAKAELGDH